MEILYKYVIRISVISGQGIYSLDGRHLLHLVSEEHLQTGGHSKLVHSSWDLASESLWVFPLSCAGLCELQRCSFFLGLQPRLERDFCELSVHAAVSLGSSLVFCLVFPGWKHLWEAVPASPYCTCFTEWSSSGLRERRENPGHPPRSVLFLLPVQKLRFLARDSRR